MKSLAEKFGALLRELRKEQKITQESLAHECGLDRTYISLLERGLRQPTLTTLFTLARVLQVNPSSIIKDLERK